MFGLYWLSVHVAAGRLRRTFRTQYSEILSSMLLHDYPYCTFSIQLPSLGDGLSCHLDDILELLNNESFRSS